MNVPSRHLSPAAAMPLSAPPRGNANHSPLRRAVTAVGRYTIHWLELGDESNDSVVLLHGLAGSSRWWERNLTALATRFHLLIPDLVGFGRTRRIGRLPALAEVAGVLARWLEQLGMPRAHVVGHSMGGQIAVHLATRDPQLVERLVLVDAAGIPRPLRPSALVRLAFELVPPVHWGDPQFLPVILRDALTAGPRTLLQATAHILRDDLRPLLPHVQAPTLIVWGEWDTLIPLSHARELSRGIPDARLVVLRGAAHNPMVDRAADFNRVVCQFLQGAAVAE